MRLEDCKVGQKVAFYNDGIRSLGRVTGFDGNIRVKIVLDPPEYGHDRRVLPQQLRLLHPKKKKEVFYDSDKIYHCLECKHGNCRGPIVEKKKEPTQSVGTITAVTFGRSPREFWIGYYNSTGQRATTVYYQKPTTIVGYNEVIHVREVLE